MRIGNHFLDFGVDLVELTSSRYLLTRHCLLEIRNRITGLPFVDLFPQSASFGESRVWAIPLAGGRFLRIWSVSSEPVWFGDYLAGVIPLTASLAFSNVVPRGWARRLARFSLLDHPYLFRGMPLMLRMSRHDP